jgi:hypothetical protein
VSFPGPHVFRFFLLPALSTSDSEEDHSHHTCDARQCPFPCELCKRLCSHTDHLHGLELGAVHLCGLVLVKSCRFLSLRSIFSENHACSSLCNGDGICEIDTAPQSIEATFIGSYETFQYTKVNHFNILSGTLIDFL